LSLRGYFIPDPRQKQPRYCGQAVCQHARKAAWQREKMRNDPDYRANQKRCQQDWCRANSDYWKKYRRKRPEQARRNRELQKVRNAGRRSRDLGEHSPPLADPGMNASLIAKMDASKSLGISCQEPFSGQFWLVPVIAKMDALKVNVYRIPTSST